MYYWRKTNLMAFYGHKKKNVFGTLKSESQQKELSVPDLYPLLLEKKLEELFRLFISSRQRSSYF